MGSLHLPANYLIIEGIIRPVDPKPLRNVSCPWAKPVERKKRERRERGGWERVREGGPPNLVLCVYNASQQSLVVYHLHTKLQRRGWWCHKWQALTGRISIPHNSGSPCMSDKFMILSKCCSPILLCIRMGVFDVARFQHAVWLVSLIQRMWLTQH